VILYPLCIQCGTDYAEFLLLSACVQVAFAAQVSMEESCQRDYLSGGHYL
jgi:hypothetical protein